MRLAKIPETKNTTKNLLPPINFSRIEPNKASANKLKKRCNKFPCKNTAVINLQTSKKDKTFSAKISVNPAIKI